MRMELGLLGRKLGVTRVFRKDGTVVAVTAIHVAGNVVVQKKAEATDGYTALQIGFDDQPERVANKPMLKHFAKAGTGPKRVLREFRTSAKESEAYAVGQTLGIQLFKEGDTVDVIGLTKGRGFTGVMKRHNFRGAHDSHGVHEYFRHGGSIGTNMTPGRTFKGRKMPGQYGNQRITVQNLHVHQVREEDQILLVTGAVPGPTNGIVSIHKAIKVAKTRKVKG